MALPVTLTSTEFKNIRLHLGETQELFAARLGYATVITISYKENGKRTISRQDEKLLQEYIPLVRRRRNKA